MGDDETISPEERAHRARMQKLEREQDAKVRGASERRGVIVVHTGDGKGKSTAAFGTALRAVGHGMRVGIVQFIKGSWKTGEQVAIRRIPEIDHVVSGDGYTWKSQDRARDIASVRRGWERTVEMIEASRGPEPRYGLVILDELNVALSYDYLPAQEVVEVLKAKPRDLNLVITGRGIKPEIVEVADTVTEMKLVKHAFEAGVPAQRGIEF
jgi:cob(I)alamin adenosyltransferase